MDELIAKIVADLGAELTITDSNYNESLLEIKVKKAIKDVQTARRYPDSYTDVMIVSDLENLYPQIRDISLYDYNTVGVDFQKSHNENSVSRVWTEREKLFYGVLPLSRGV